MALDDEAMEQAVNQLFGVRRAITTIPRLSDDIKPTSDGDAYAIQGRLVERLLTNEGAKRIGWKVGATNATARQTLGCDEPFYGVLMSSRHLASPTTVAATDFTLRIIEPEFALTLGADLGPSETPWTAESVADAVADMMPAIELVSPSYAAWTEVGGLSMIADNAAHGTWITGEPVKDWRAHDLLSQAVTLTVNGKVEREGTGAGVDGGPLGSLAWLANRLAADGKYLAAGDMVTTGSATAVYPAGAGEALVADFGPFGSVRLTIT